LIWLYLTFSSNGKSDKEITVAKKPYHQKISGRREQLGPYPMERLKRVEQPTTRITDDIPRFDEREHGFARAMRVPG
jgi:hypothetical protein